MVALTTLAVFGMELGEFAFAALALVACVGGIALETWVYSTDRWWHEGPKRDPRNGI